MSVQSTIQSYPRKVRWLLLAVAVTAILSLLYGIQAYVGGPLNLMVTNEIYDLALSRDGSLLAGGTEDGTIHIWSLQNDWASRTLKGHSGPVVRVFFKPNSDTLLSVGQDGTIRTWNIPDRQVETVLETGKSLNDAALSIGGTTLATIDEDGMIEIWDIALEEVSTSIQAGKENNQSVALSYDGTLVAAGAGTNVRIWSARTGEVLHELEGRWEDEVEQEDWVGHEGPITALAFNADNTLLASGSTDNNIVFWDLEQDTARWIGDGHYSAITQLTFNDDGDSLLSASQDNKSRTWRVPGGRSSATFVGHLSAVTSAIFGHLPDQLYTAGDDGTVRQWETVNNTETRFEWTRPGLTPIWNQTFKAWMLLSGVLGLLLLWTLWRGRLWGQLATIGLYLLGPVIVLGLPILEVAFYPTSWGTRLLIAWPLLLLAGWYTALIVLLTQTSVEAYYETPPHLPLAEQLARSRRARRVHFGLFTAAVWFAVLVILYSVLRQFNLDLAFMGHFFSFIMGGAGTTVYVSAASITLAVVLALLGALGRLSKNPIANGISGFYISLIRGTPLLVQIYIWYLGLPRLDIVLQPLVAGILALGVNYGAYMTEIFRAGIQAIGKGQREAALALGMSGSQTFRRIVLPQAFRIVIPPIGNQFIAMMKDSSLVSIMAVWELSFRAQKIGRQYFRSLETFIIAAAFYWLLTVVFQFLQGKLEDYMARGERR